jgi:hypothetical protein
MAGGGGCIFCGASPQTKTHVFRKAWIERLMVPAAGPFEMVQGTSDLTGAGRESSWPSKEFGIAPGAACNACNSGWMDQVDRAAEQIVEPMVLGRRATIRKIDQQKAVARWVSQVAILIDQSQIQQVIPTTITERFYEDREPIPGITIWLARTVLDWSVEAWERAWVISARSQPSPADNPNLCLITFRIVQLVVQALIPLDAETARTIGFTRGKDQMRFLKQLWPSRYTPVAWPPTLAISPATMEVFARSFEPANSVPGDTWTTS